jgi:AraC family transcriptional regulator, positive regulator of tynA and feaB
MGVTIEVGTLATPAAQFMYWREVICETWFGLWAERSKSGPFDARIELHEIGPVQVAHAYLPQHRMGRSATEMARLPQSAYCLHQLHEGSVHGRYRGAEYQAGAGDLLLFDTTDPCESFVIDQPIRTTIVHIPRSLIDDPRAVLNRAPVRLRSRDGVGALLAGYMSSLSHAASTLPPQATGKVGSILCDLVVAAFQPSEQPNPRQSGLREVRLAAAQQLISKSLADPEFGIGRVAERLGVSRRYVHKLFESTGRTFSETLVYARLNASYHALSDIRQSRRTIADIAFGCGFNDLSWFYRCYRERWRETPGDTRVRTTGTS